MFQWKMNRNPDPSKEAQEVFFSRKLKKKSIHPFINFNNNPIEQISSQKYLGIILYTKLDFQEHIKNILNSIKLSDYYGSSKTSCLEDHYLQFLNCVSSLILIMAMLYMTRVIIILFIKKWSKYNTTQHWL